MWADVDGQASAVALGLEPRGVRQAKRRDDSLTELARQAPPVTNVGDFYEGELGFGDHEDEQCFFL